jgi:serine/threonine protein kinase
MVLDKEAILNELQQLTLEKKLDFIYEGAYGCAYKLEEPNNKKPKWVLKVQKLTDEAKREEDIGKIIRKIPKYQLYFAPIIKTKEITIGEVADDELKKCTIITTEPDLKRKFVTNRIKYAGKNTLGDYVLMILEKKPRLFLRTFFGAFFDMLYNISILNENNIIHFDLKENNSIFNEQHDRPVVIDFGMSIDTKLLTPNNYPEFFFTYGYDYPPWCFEISVISYAVSEFGTNFEKELLTQEQVDKLCNNFTDINPIFYNDGETGHHDIYTAEERVSYNSRLKESMKEFVGGSWKIVIDAYLQSIKTWDIYAVHVMFLLLIYHIHIYEYNTAEFPFIKTFIDKLKREITALPKDRKTYVDISEELMKDLGETGRKQVEILGATIDAAASNTEKISHIKIQLNKFKLRELKKEKMFYAASNLEKK